MLRSAAQVSGIRQVEASMLKVTSMAALVAGALLLSPVHSAFAISSESADDSSGGANVADPDDQMDQIANPDSGTDGSATIEIPPIDVPGDSDDYTPPESEDDSGDVPADSSSGD